MRNALRQNSHQHPRSHPNLRYRGCPPQVCTAALVDVGGDTASCPGSRNAPAKQDTGQQIPSPWEVTDPKQRDWVWWSSSLNLSEIQLWVHPWSGESCLAAAASQDATLSLSGAPTVHPGESLCIRLSQCIGCMGGSWSLNSWHHSSPYSRLRPIFCSPSNWIFGDETLPISLLRSQG